MNPLPSISVVACTAGRASIFLRRALGSIRAQTVPPHEVVVFNAGGPTTAVEEAVRAEPLNGVATVIRHAAPLGHAAALNQAIEAAHGAWIALLDDDDSWEPSFLEQTGAVIAREQSAADFGGVATQTVAIYERFGGGAIEETGREPFNPDFIAVDLAALVVENRFTNNALVLRRDAFRVVGRFREDLPALYDWEFNVRLAAKFRLEVVPEMLARYHQRPADDVEPNTRRAEHTQMRVRIRNEWLRADLAAGRIGLGQLALAGENLGAGRALAQWERWRRRVGAWLGRREGSR